MTTTPEHPKMLANQLFMLIKTAQIHDPSNRAFLSPLEQFRSLLSDMVNEEGPLSLESVEMSLYLNEVKIRTDISTFGTFQYLNQEFEQKNVGGVRFARPPSTDELVNFLRLFVRGSDSTQIGAETLNHLLGEKEIDSIEFIERKEKRSVAGETVLPRQVEQKRRALKNYVKAIDVMKNAATNVLNPRAMEVRRAKRVVYNMVDICLDEGFSFIGLSSIKNYDEYTFNHSVNVCIISIGFGKNLGLNKKQIGELGMAGLYHDYGKLSIPKEILNKPGKFDATEWEVMKSHPLKSIKTLLQMKSFQENDIKKMVAAFEHHRNYDLTGYPQTGVKKKLNFYSRVVAIADAYDAMTTQRVYQRAMLPTMALKILMDNAGTKFDPLLVRAFVNTVGIYPVGSLLRLSDGRMAMVAKVPTDPAKLYFPAVKIVADASGNRVEDGLEVDLAEGETGLAITGILRPEEHNINVASVLFGDVAQGAGAKIAPPSSTSTQ